MADLTPSCYWITGLSGAGKTTLAQALHARLREQGVTAVVLDGDELRRGLCSDLGMLEADRRENIRRAGEVARLLADAGLVAICAFVSPFAADRERVRTLFAAGGYAEVYLSTSLATCAARDAKGLYAKARAGALSGLTGWDAPYDVPAEPEFEFNTEFFEPGAMVDTLLAPWAGTFRVNLRT